jgi:hypothetical protein
MEYVVTGLVILAFGVFIYKKMTKKEKPSEFDGVGYGVGGGKPDGNIHTQEK